MSDAGLAAVSVADGLGWGRDWLWGIPLTVTTLISHVALLGLMNRASLEIESRKFLLARPGLRFTVVMSATVLIAMLIHTSAAGYWALAFVWLGALPDIHTAMLYSMEAQTSFGHVSFDLAPHWQMLGALEALVGVVMAGLTVAFLLSIMHTFGHKRS